MVELVICFHVALEIFVWSALAYEKEFILVFMGYIYVL